MYLFVFHSALPISPEMLSPSPIEDVHQTPALFKSMFYRSHTLWSLCVTSFHVPSCHVVSRHVMSRHVTSCYFSVHTVSSEHVDSMKEIDNVFSETMMQAGGKKLATRSKIMSYLHTFTIASAMFCHRFLLHIFVIMS